jgi:carbon monoxide dehydrogenase subunit G
VSVGPDYEGPPYLEETTMIKMLACAAALAVVAATPTLAAHAIQVSKSIDVDAPPAKVWETIGDFCGIGDWHPVVEKCELSTKNGKKLRTLSLKGGGTLVEEQGYRDDDDMEYSYSIIDGPLPVENYNSTLEVEPEGAGSKVTWSSTFNAKDVEDAKAEQAIADVYDAGLKGLAEKVK